MSTPFDHIPSCSRTADYTKATATAPMSRLDEVEAEITAILRKTKRPQLAAAALARTLAAEVDELRGKLAIMEDDMCAAAGELLVPFPQPGSIDAKLLIANRLLKGEIAELRGKLDALRAEADPQALVICHMQGRAEGDDVITKLLDLTAPHVDEFGNRQWWQYKRPEQMHARACEIAGRMSDAEVESTRQNSMYSWNGSLRTSGR